MFLIVESALRRSRPTCRLDGAAGRLTTGRRFPTCPTKQHSRKANRLSHQEIVAAREEIKIL